jgi:hypothetical protein
VVNTISEIISLFHYLYLFKDLFSLGLGYFLRCRSYEIRLKKIFLLIWKGFKFVILLLFLKFLYFIFIFSTYFHYLTWLKGSCILDRRKTSLHILNHEHLIIKRWFPLKIVLFLWLFLFYGRYSIVKVLLQYSRI